MDREIWVCVTELASGNDGGLGKALGLRFEYVLRNKERVVMSFVQRFLRFEDRWVLSRRVGEKIRDVLV